MLGECFPYAGEHVIDMTDGRTKTANQKLGTQGELVPSQKFFRQLRVVPDVEAIFQFSQNSSLDELFFNLGDIAFAQPGDFRQFADRPTPRFFLRSEGEQELSGSRTDSFAFL